MSNDFLKDLGIKTDPLAKFKPKGDDQIATEIMQEYKAENPAPEYIPEEPVNFTPVITPINRKEPVNSGILSDKGIQLILDWEVGGGKAYYNKFLKKPSVPAWQTTTSGCTIGIGWDAGFNDRASLYREWGKYLSSSDLEAMSKVLGLHGRAAFNALSTIASVDVTWEDAYGQFTEYTVPRFYALALKSFKGLANAPQPVIDVVMSLVFNRGNSLKGESRREMANISTHVSNGQYDKIAQEIVDMKRLWPNVKGLRSRRDAEAKYLRENL